MFCNQTSTIGLGLLKLTSHTLGVWRQVELSCDIFFTLCGSDNYKYNNEGLLLNNLKAEIETQGRVHVPGFCTRVYASLRGRDKDVEQITLDVDERPALISMPVNFN